MNSRPVAAIGEMELGVGRGPMPLHTLSQIMTLGTARMIRTIDWRSEAASRPGGHVKSTLVVAVPHSLLITRIDTTVRPSRQWKGANTQPTPHEAGLAPTRV